MQELQEARADVRNMLFVLAAVVLAILSICALIILIFGLFYGYDAVR